MQVFRAAALARTFGIAVAILWATVGGAVAQGTTGSIAGRVIDDSKAALPGATVTIREVETGQSRVLATDPQGRYRADALVPGKYAVTVELSGFRTAQYQDVSLSVGQAAVLDVQMQIGGITERVVVAVRVEEVEGEGSDDLSFWTRALTLQMRDGNGYALLKTYVVTGDEVWLERARRFAVHALEQVQGRYTLFTGDIGAALFARSCLRGDARFPTMDVW